MLKPYYLPGPVPRLHRPRGRSSSRSCTVYSILHNNPPTTSFQPIGTSFFTNGTALQAIPMLPVPVPPRRAESQINVHQPVMIPTRPIPSPQCNLITRSADTFRISLSNSTVELPVKARISGVVVCTTTLVFSASIHGAPNHLTAERMALAVELMEQPCGQVQHPGGIDCRCCWHTRLGHLIRIG